MSGMTIPARDVAIVYDVAYPFVAGGGQKRMYEVATRLCRRGWKVTWYSLKCWEGDDVVTADGITYRGLPAHAQLYAASGRRSIREALSFGRACWRARHDIARHSILWCGQWPYFHIFALQRACRGRIIVDWWETWGSHWIEYLGALGTVGYVLERIAAFQFSRSTKLVTLVPMARNDVVSAGAREAAVSIIPNGINCAEIAGVTRAASGSDIVYAGRLKNHKNVDHLLRAIAMIRDRSSTRVSADIIGDGPERVRLGELSRELGLEDQVRFHGELSTAAMIALMKAARIFVHPSTKEGGGSITLLEANACGLPVVIYRHPNGIDPSLITNGSTGLVVEEVGPAPLASALEGCFGSTAAWQMTTEACTESARRYDWDVIADRYEVLLSKALDYGAVESQFA